MAKSRNRIVSIPRIRKQDAVKEIRRLAQKETGRVFVSDHAHMRMLEREITLRQVIRVLSDGDLISGPE